MVLLAPKRASSLGKGKDKPPQVLVSLHEAQAELELLGAPPAALLAHSSPHQFHLLIVGHQDVGLPQH